MVNDNIIIIINYSLENSWFIFPHDQGSNSLNILISRSQSSARKKIQRPRSPLIDISYFGPSARQILCAFKNLIPGSMWNSFYAHKFFSNQLCVWISSGGRFAWSRLAPQPTQKETLPWSQNSHSIIADCSALTLYTHGCWIRAHLEQNFVCAAN